MAGGGKRVMTDIDDMHDRDNVVETIIPENWDKSAYDYMILMRDQMATLAGVEIVGSGMMFTGEADFFMIDGKNKFSVVVKPLPIQH
jgi:hypothetical protein